MKTRTLLILILILGILAGAGALIIRLKAPERSQERMGNHLFEQLPVNDIMSITIKGDGEAVTLVKKTDFWVVANRFHYPADFSKIIDLVRNFKDAKIGRQFASSEDKLKRLSLKDPEDSEAPQGTQGIRILLQGEKGASLASILLGKTRKGGEGGAFPDGRYVMLGDEPTIYLIDKHFPLLEKKPSAWLDKELVKVAGDEVKKISCAKDQGKKVVYTLERPKKGNDFETENLQAGQKIDKSKINRLSGALSALRIEDVLDPSTDPVTIGMDASTKLEYHLFNGTIYRVYVGKGCLEADRCYLKVEVDYQKPKGETDKPAEGESGKKGQGSPKKTPEEYALEAKHLNDRLSPWVYVIPKWQHSAFVTDLDQLLEKTDKSKTKKNG